MKSLFFLLFGILFLQLSIKAQSESSRIDNVSLKKIYKGVFKSYKKSRPLGAETNEGFFILLISNPYDIKNSKVIEALDDTFNKFGALVFSNLKGCIKVDSNIKQIVIPVVNIVKCKRHNYVTSRSHLTRVMSTLEERGIFVDSSVLVLEEMTMTALGHLEH